MITLVTAGAAGSLWLRCGVDSGTSSDKRGAIIVIEASRGSVGSSGGCANCNACNRVDINDLPTLPRHAWGT